MFQNLCERAGVLVEREVLIEDRVNQIGGHADGILELNKTKFVLEIKTINSRGFTSLDTAPMESHRNQVMAYMKSLNLPLACIVYLDKDHSVAKEYTVKFNSQTYDQKVATKIKAYFAFLSQRVPPPKEGVSPQSQVCKYCPYTQICFSTEHLKGFLQKL
jgi:CRISPR/Cas system-associated exonuclease Cas4 (RecB family)